MTPGLENAIGAVVEATIYGYAASIGFVVLVAFLSRGGGES